MHTYAEGASMALAGIADRFVTEKRPGTMNISVNILGATPLDFTVNGNIEHIRRELENNDIEVVSCWAIGSTLEELQNAPAADLNLVVSGAGLGAAEILQKRFGTPYLLGRPYDWFMRENLLVELHRLVTIPERNLRSVIWQQERIGGGEIVVIGEGVSACSLAYAIEQRTGRAARAICATEMPEEYLGVSDKIARDEDELIPLLDGAKYIIADPLYQPICPKTAKCIRLPHEGFSGRIFRDEIPDMTEDISYITGQL